VSSQTEAPVAQLERPRWHGFAGVQARPAVQATQAPALQTWSAPQVAPSASGVAGAVLSTQVEVPVAQLVTPRTQWFAGVQASPAVQATQAPALQTRSAPHVAPSRTFPLSVQVADPVPQVTVPVLQGSTGTQAVPHAADA
jgi:hypothetical protein